MREHWYSCSLLSVVARVYRVNSNNGDENACALSWCSQCCYLFIIIINCDKAHKKYDISTLQLLQSTDVNQLDLSHTYPTY